MSDVTPQSGIDSSILKALHTSGKDSLDVESLRDAVNNDIPYLKVTCGNVRQRADEMIEFHMLQVDHECDERRYELAQEIRSGQP